MRTVPTGRVKWFDADKGFGFVTQDDGEDVYLRASALPSGVRPGVDPRLGYPTTGATTSRRSGSWPSL